MRVTRAGGNGDLALTAAAALASLLLTALPVDGLLASLALIPLVLVLPGYAVAAAMFPSARLARSERLVYVFALSVGAAALGGLVWQLAFGLERVVWAILLTSITLVGCAVAFARRSAPTTEQVMPRASLPRLDAATAALATIAVVIAVFATATAIDGLEEQRADAHFSALWIVPSAHGFEGFKIGISNHQGAVHRYRLRVDGAGRTIREWDGKLGSRAEIGVLVPSWWIPDGARLIASLYRDGALYRRVKLQTETGT